MMIPALVLALSGAEGTLGESYLTQDQALKLVFPNGERVAVREVELDEATRHKVALRYGASVAPRQHVFVGVREGKVTGYAMILREVTKTLWATFIVGITAEGEIHEVAVMSHDDHIGTECRRDDFLAQFKGRTSADRLPVGAAIGGLLPVRGATLSCQSVARAVRKALAIVQYQFLDRPENVKALVQEEPVRQKRYVMGTFCGITAYGPAEAVERAFAEIRRLDKVLSNYDEKSELSRLNRERAIEAGPDLLEFVRVSKKYSDESGGAFDVTVGPLVALWGFRGDKFRVPPDDEIAAALKKVGSRGVRVEGNRITLSEGVEVDPGAIGKGIAVDRAADILKKAGITRALVDFGSSIVALGTWEVGVRDPFDGRKAVGVVTLTDESLSTSGNYEKFFKSNGTTYCHILDPRTGRPVQGVASASIVAPTGTESDALSTATFVLGTLPSKAAALLVTDKGEVRSNEGWQRRFKKASP